MIETLTEGSGFSTANLTKGTLPDDLDSTEVRQFDFSPPKAELLRLGFSIFTDFALLRLWRVELYKSCFELNAAV